MKFKVNHIPFSFLVRMSNMLMNLDYKQNMKQIKNQEWFTFLTLKINLSQ